MKAIDFVIMLGVLNDSSNILKKILIYPDHTQSLKNFLQLKSELISLYQKQLEKIFQEKRYLIKQDKRPIVAATNILEVEIQDDIYIEEINSQTKKLLTELIEIKPYGELFKAVQHARRVIYELITTEADFINACRKIAGAKPLLIEAIQSYASYCKKNNSSDKLVEDYMQSCIKALEYYSDDSNCFMMKYKDALQSTEQFESIIYWLNDHFISTDFANYFDEKLKKMALSSDMLYKLILRIKETGNDNGFNLSEAQKQALALVENEISKPFQRVPRYVLLIKDLEKTFAAFIKLNIVGIAENNSVKSLTTILKNLIILVECKTENINRLISLRDYSENLNLNVSALSKQLMEFVERNGQPSFFKFNRKLLQLEVNVAAGLQLIVDKAIKQLKQPAADNQTKLLLLESIAKFLLKEIRDHFKLIDKYLIDNYKKEQKSNKMEDFSKLGELLTPFIAKFQQFSDDDKQFLLQEWDMQKHLEELTQLVYFNNLSRLV